MIGGGYAGVEAAKGLDKAFDVTLVAGGECLRHVIAGLRASVLPEQTPRMLVPYDNLLKKGTVKTCKASKINADECTVTLATGESLPYDYLVLATGILHPKTGRRKERARTTRTKRHNGRDAATTLSIEMSRTGLCCCLLLLPCIYTKSRGCGTTARHMQASAGAALQNYP